jgi:uncharacterized NAD(P)/FAD-binding protein YdhS
MEITLYERSGSAGTGMPYRTDTNDAALLANIASVELPPLLERLHNWLEGRSDSGLGALGVELTEADERTFHPRVVLGSYFRDQLFRLVELGAKRGFEIAVHVRHDILDIVPSSHVTRVSGYDNNGEMFFRDFDDVVLATGHAVSAEQAPEDNFFDTPYPTSRLEYCPPERVGIFGTSLSGIDAAVTIASRHGSFSDDESTYTAEQGAEGLKLTMMSRNGYLPEADFYCPLPYEPLDIFTDAAVDAEIEAGSEGLLDRVFAIFVAQMLSIDPTYLAADSSPTADSFPHLYYSARSNSDPIQWARKNLIEAEANHQKHHTVGWRYAILRMHEPFERAVAHFDDVDGRRFSSGLKRVFVDNYAAIPPASVRRILALADAGHLHILALGKEYSMSDQTAGPPFLVSHEHGESVFDAIVIATGEPRLSYQDYPFPGIMAHLALVERNGQSSDLDEDSRIPGTGRGCIYFLALPYLLTDRPFVQGLVGCHELGEAAGTSIASRAHKKTTEFAPRVLADA